jgi:SP family sugar:H+ symporter-like MFS transporter
LTGAFVANFALARYAGGSTATFWFGFQAWRWMFWLQAIPAAIYLVALLVIPESPRFLVAQKREEEAHKVLTRLFGTAEADRKVGEIRRSLSGDQHRPRMSDLKDRTTGKIRPIVWAGIGLAVFQQLVGINVVFYYGAVLWQAVGFSENDALLINVLSGALSIGACLVTVVLIDRIGRKPLLAIGSAGMAVTLALMAWCFSQATGSGSDLQLPGNVGPIALVAANLYVVFFGVSWGPVVWVLLGEMFPNRIRAAALGLAAAGQWAANWLITVTFPGLREHLGLAYGFYGLCAVLSGLFVWRWVMETKGVSLEDMHGEILKQEA